MTEPATQQRTDVELHGRRHADLVPSSIGGVKVPATVEQLQQLLEWSKNYKPAPNQKKPSPLPYRASALLPQLQEAMYLWFGIPHQVLAEKVMIFAGRPYVSADGAIQVAFDLGANVYHDQVRVKACADPASLCPKWDEAGPKQMSYIVRAHCVHGNKRIAIEHQACEHTTMARPLHQMAITRALRKACLPVAGIAAELLAPDDVVDAEEVRAELGDGTEPVGPSFDDGDDDPLGIGEEPAAQQEQMWT